MGIETSFIGENGEVRNMGSEEIAALAFIEQADRAKHRLGHKDILALKRYRDMRLRPGSFLAAVVCNNLSDACKYADPSNRRKLFEYIEWLYNNAPATCWGSNEKMEAWIKQGEEKLNEQN